MNQTDRGSYRTKESLTHSFTHSCLGKILIFAGFCAVIVLLAHLSVPDKEKMTEEMNDNIRQCIMANDSIKGDWIDDAVNNVGYIFTHADSIPNEEIIANFERYNKLDEGNRQLHPCSLRQRRERHPQRIFNYRNSKERNLTS